MSKKKTVEREKDEEKDLEDEEHEEGEEEEEASPAKAVHDKRSRPRAKAHDDHDDHGHGHDDHEDEEEDVDADDPYWWTPHAVLSVLVLIGVLGFFGVFNKALGGLAPKNMPTADANAAHSPATPAKPASVTPLPNPHGSGRMAPTNAPTGETYGAKHLLVQYKGSMRAPPTITRSEEEAKARATEAQKKAKGGAKFEDLVKDYSDEPNAAQRGGDLGTFRKGQMVPEFQTAVEGMKVGEVSDLVKTPFGYHVILRTK